MTNPLNPADIEEEKTLKSKTQIHSLLPISAKPKPELEVLLPPDMESSKKSDDAGNFESVDLSHDTDADAKQRPSEPSKVYEDLSKVDIPIEEAVSNNKIVIFPQYKESKTKRLIEIYPPNPENYLAIGYNRDPDDGKKHYRYYIHEELEKISIFEKSAFEEFNILKGASRGVDELPTLHTTHQEKDGQKSTVECVGKFKALIRVIDYPPKWQPFGFLTGLMGSKDFPDDEADFESIARTLLVKTQCVVRVYIIDAFDLEQKDSFSKSDPYYKVKLGQRSIDNREDHQEDVCDPKFYKCYDFETTIPGQSLLKISMW
eukprot:CAMPEP_0202945150 /NCGR_PEP_ID=MMETSP1395-20130829/6104_1 /ASSEMBLY_ACC=CAM_ASM_000871 /TAXON_ID=5961 /ORGANISM="Blepharisma japonicum, Strain Stock R1072" /LENGTH=316 /DNA_ID=CAMNT_0049644819 /DNA_START=1181 /DNA_END=2128 /DNA_ORIENTATION=+